jgi:hypothetical protein
MQLRRQHWQQTIIPFQGKLRHLYGHAQEIRNYIGEKYQNTPKKREDTKASLTDSEQ